MKYWIGPWQWRALGEAPDSSWNPPAGTVAVVDLRPYGSVGLRGTTGSLPFGFFAGGDALSLSTDYALLGTGDCREIVATNALRSTWQFLLNYRPAGDRLVDMLWDQLTNGADADGEANVAPLVPRSDGSVELVLAGHSVVKSERFGDKIQRGGRWSAVLTSQLRKQFAREFERRPEVAEKMLGNMVSKYQLGENWRHVVPPNLRDHTQGPRRPTTALADLFDRADENLNTGPWRYNASQDYEVFSNACRNTLSSGYRQAEHTSDLSSDDHWSEVAWGRTPSNYGPAVRSMDPTAAGTDFYYMQRFGDIYISKVINGTASNLANASAGSTASGDIDRMQADGSTIEAFVNASSRVSVTDTSLSGSVRAGLLIFADAGTVYTRWAAEDILAGGGGYPYYDATRVVPNPTRFGACEL